MIFFSRRRRLNFLLLSLLTLTIADILIDIGNGEDVQHFGMEGITMLLLVGLCWFFARRIIQATSADCEQGSAKRWQILFYSTFGLFVLLAADDFLTFVGNFDDVSEYVVDLALFHNFHEVTPGRFFRSGEMGNDDLRSLLVSKQIKTLIDLRLGDETPEPGESTEAEIADELEVRYEHIRLSSLDLPSPEKVNKLLDLYESAQLPILVHCSNGTHRSGFASAVWLLEHEQGSYEQVEEQLSPRYGFFQFERRIRSARDNKTPLNSLVWKYMANANPSESFRDWVSRELRP